VEPRPENVTPLGVFGVVRSEQYMRGIADRLRALSGAIPKSERQPIANYLRECEMVIPLMEHTRDVLGRAFEVPGGSAVCTDGTYYWRLDAAEYVLHYGIELPQEFLAHGATRNWVPPALTQDQCAKLEDRILETAKRLATPA
jgi:hypothetical protein